MFEAELEREIVSETSGDFKRLALSLLQGNRDENEVVYNEVAKEDALVIHYTLNIIQYTLYIALVIHGFILIDQIKSGV